MKLLAVLFCAISRLAEADRMNAADHPSVLTAIQNCSVLPQYTCYKSKGFHHFVFCSKHALTCKLLKRVHNHVHSSVCKSLKHYVFLSISNKIVADYFKDIWTNDTDPGMCCALCNEDEKCGAWSHDATNNPKKAGSDFRCHLFEKTPSETTPGDCSVGTAARNPPHPPAPPMPRGDKPNIVFLVVESTDG